MDLKFGKTTFHLAGLVGWTKEKFKKEFVGKLDYDIDLVWNTIEKAMKAQDKVAPKAPNKALKVFLNKKDGSPGASL